MQTVIDSNLARKLHGGGSGRRGVAPRNSGGPVPGPSKGLVPAVPRSTAVADEVQTLIQSALAWRNLVHTLWVELGRPPVPGFPASRVQQILWGELSPENGFFSALLATLTSRSRAGSGESIWFRNLLNHTHGDSDTVDALRLAGRFLALHPAATSGDRAQSQDMVMVDPEGKTVMAVEVKDTCPGSGLTTPSALESALADENSGLSLWERMKFVLEERPEPDAVESEAEFMTALRQLRERTKLSFRQLEERSKSTTAGWLPRSSAADMLRRETLPKADALWALTAALGLPREEQDRWEAARSRLSREHHPRRRMHFTPVKAIDDLDIDIVGGPDETAA